MFFFTPFIVSSHNSELFELPKMHFVYLTTGLIFSLHLINVMGYRLPLFRRTTLHLPLLLFLLSQTISTILSIDPHTSLYGYYSRLNGGLLSLLSFSALYSIAVIYFDTKFQKTIVNTFLLSGSFVALYGISQHFGIDKHLWVQDVQARVFSTLGQPNWLAAYLCILLPFALHKYFSAKSLVHRSYFLLTTFSLYLCLLFTKSKSGILAAGISLLIYFSIHTIRQLRLHQFKTTIIFPALLFVILSFWVKNPIRDLVISDTQSSPPVDTSLNITPSQDIRKIVWQGSIDLWRQFPLFGTGTETFAYSYYWTRPVSHNLTSEWDFLYNKAHNEYLNYLSTTGTLGLLTYSLLIILTLVNLTKKSFSEANKFALPALAAFISILVTNFAGFSVTIVSLFFFLLYSFTLDPLPPNKNNRFSLIGLTPFILLYLTTRLVLFSYLADITFAQSQTLDSQNDYQSAFDSLEKSIYYKNDPLYHSKISSLAAKLVVTTPDPQTKQYYLEKSISHSDYSIHVSPANTSFWKERAQTFYYLSSTNTDYFMESIESLLKVTKLAPTDAKTYYLIGKFLESVDQYDDATTYYQQAIILKPNYDHALFNLAHIYYQQKDSAKAIQYLELTLKYAPNNLEAAQLLNELKDSP